VFGSSGTAAMERQRPFRRWVGGRWTLGSAIASLALLLAARPASGAAYALTGALPSGTNFVDLSTPMPPRPMPSTYVWQVSTQQGARPPGPAWQGNPLLLSNGTTVVCIPEIGMCAGPLEDCPQQNEIQAFPAGGGQAHDFQTPLWTFKIPPDDEGTPPVWSDGAITFIEGPMSSVASHVMLVRLDPDGKVLSEKSVAYPETGLGVPGLSPADNGLFLEQEGELEKISSNGAVEWSIASNAPSLFWTTGPVLLGSYVAPGDTIAQEIDYAFSSATGKVLWRFVPGPPRGVNYKSQVVPTAKAAYVTYTYRPYSGGPMFAVARDLVTGTILWRQTVRDVDLNEASSGDPYAVLSGQNLVFCTSIGGVDHQSRTRPRCEQLSASTGAFQDVVTVPNAPAGSLVDPIASSDEYLLVQVLQAPFQTSPSRKCGVNWAGCAPTRIFAEAIPWRGHGPVVVRSGAVEDQLTYDIGPESATTVTGPTSSWQW
jgi:outer membrane protein assembly factor BamB